MFPIREAVCLRLSECYMCEEELSFTLQQFPENFCCICELGLHKNTISITR